MNKLLLVRSYLSFKWYTVPLQQNARAKGKSEKQKQIYFCIPVYTRYNCASETIGQTRQ